MYKYKVIPVNNGKIDEAQCKIFDCLVDAKSHRDKIKSDYSEVFIAILFN